jgi:hypothetical protein
MVFARRLDLEQPMMNRRNGGLAGRMREFWGLSV